MGRMKGDVVVNDDRDLLDFIQEQIDYLDTVQVKIGIFGDTDSFQVMKASVHEFGLDIKVTPKMRAWMAYQGFPLKATTTTISIPERSFIRSTFDNKGKTIDDMIVEQLEAMLRGETNGKQITVNLEIDLVGLVRATMHEIQSPPLSGMTLSRRKGTDANALIDKGDMWRAVSSRIID